MDKRRFTTALARYLFNPLARGLFKLGIPPPGTAILETTGRKSGQPRRTPVTNGLDGETFWIVAEHGLSAEEYQHVLKIMGREPTLVELGIFSAMWSEHCSYKSSKVWLKKLPTSAPWVIQGPGENAGVIDIGDGQAAIFKMESHNHPSFIEPYQGAATGVGGILRDVFTMGARPIANLNALRFGDPSHPKTRQLVAGSFFGRDGAELRFRRAAPARPAPAAGR